MGIDGVVRCQYRAHAIQTCGGFGHGADAFSRDENIDFPADLAGRLDHVGGGLG